MVVAASEKALLTRGWMLEILSLLVTAQLQAHNLRAMNITKDQVVSFHYCLSVNGETVEDSKAAADPQPMSYLHGHGNIIPGLEKALEGKTVGDEIEVTVEPAEGYGEHDPEAVYRFPVKKLSKFGKVRPGAVLTVPTTQGARQLRVIKVGRFQADVDSNHPLAGQTLNFAVSIENIRAASETELAHGHVHSHDSQCETDDEKDKD